MWQNFLLFLAENRWPITFICLLGLILMAAYAVYKSFDPSKSVQNLQKKSSFQVLKRKFRDFCAGVVGKLQPLPVIGTSVRNMKYSYICLYATTEKDALYITGRCLVTCAAVFTVSLIGSILYFHDLVLSLIAAIMLMRVAYMGLKGDSLKFLSAVEDSMDDFIHAYHAHNQSIDAAFYAVINSSSPVAGHWATMYDYIQRAYAAEDPEVIQKEYYAIAPARILRNLYTCIYMTYRYGDSEKSGVSTFTENFYQIQQELVEKINNINRLRTDLFGERWFIILPVFALPLLSAYMLRYFAFEGFEMIEEFVNSPLGYTVEIICAAVSFLCYFVYERLSDDHILEPKQVDSWESRLLLKPKINAFIQRVIPYGSEKRNRLRKTLLQAGSVESVDAFTLRRYAMTLFILVVSVVSLTMNNIATVQSIRGNVYQGLAHDVYEEVLLSQNDTQVFIDEQLAADNRMLEYIDGIDGWYGKTEEEQREILLSYINDGFGYDYRGFEDDAVTRIISKADMIHMSSGMVNVWFVLIFTIGGFFAPLVIVYAQAALNKNAFIRDETADLQSTVLMLLSHKSTTPQKIVQWLSNSAVLLMEPCCKAATYGDFSDMKAATNYKPFIQLSECAEYAYNGMDMNEAFADLKQKMLIQQRERMRVADNEVQNRISRVEVCSTLSLGAAMALYMFMPIFVAMIQLFMDFSTMM